MKVVKGIYIFACVLSFFIVAVSNPPAALAATADPAEKLSKANAAFDANKMSDMSDFDPNWFKGASFTGSIYRLPAETILPWMDPELDRCKGKNGWGE